MLDSQLGFIRGFLDHVLKDVGEELNDIERRNQDGLIPTYGNLESAYDGPLSRQLIAVRAVYYEINALVEQNLYHVAHRPWIESAKPGPKTLMEIENLAKNGLRSLKIVNNLKFGEILELIQEYYEITIDDLPGWEVLSDIRTMVNAYKHRSGFVDFRNQAIEKAVIGERHIEDVDKAYRAIDCARKFLHALLIATGHKDQASC